MVQDQQAASRAVVEIYTIPSLRAPQLNVVLHARLMREGTVRPSNLASAMCALARIRQARESLPPG